MRRFYFGLLCAIFAMVVTYALMSKPAQSQSTCPSCAPITTLRAGAFVDTVGVDTFIEFGGSTYDTLWNTWRPLLEQSGIKHIRDGLPNMSSIAISRINQLYTEAGIRNHGGTYINTTAADINNYIAALPHMESIEGVNEYDTSSDPVWYTTLKNEQILIGNAIAANTAFQLAGGKRVCAPLSGPDPATTFYQQNGNATEAYCDLGNEHGALRGVYPEAPTGNGPYNVLWSGGTCTDYYFTTRYALCGALPMAGNKPIIDGEAGVEPEYPNGYVGIPCGASFDCTTGVTYADATKYQVRFLLFWLRFQPPYNSTPPVSYRAYLFHFMDMASSDHAVNYGGLLDNTGTPKPSYYAVKSALSILADTSTNFTPTPLQVAISGSTSNLFYQAFQKSDGSYRLAMWLGVASQNRSTNPPTEINVTPQAVTLQFAANYTATAGTISSVDGSLPMSPLTVNNNQVTVNINDSVTFITLTPASAGNAVTTVCRVVSQVGAIPAACPKRGVNNVTISAERGAQVADVLSPLSVVTPTPPTPPPTGCSENNYTQAVNGQEWPATFCPYAAASPWKVNLPSAPANVDQANTTRIRAMATAGTSNDIAYIGSAGGRPVYFASSSDPFYSINCGSNCYNVSNGASIRLPQPPNGIVVEPNTDQHFAVIESNGDEYDFWRGSVSGSTITAGYAVRVCNDSSCNPFGVFSTGVPPIPTTDLGAIGAGVVGYNEMTAAQNNGNRALDHALIYVTSCTNQSASVYPGSGSYSGASICNDGGGVPIGALVHLRMTDPQIDALGLSSWLTVVAKTAAHHGLYASDFGGASCVNGVSVSSSCGAGYLVFDGVPATAQAYNLTTPGTTWGNSNCGSATSCNLAPFWTNSTIASNLEVLSSCYARLTCNDSQPAAEPTY